MGDPGPYSQISCAARGLIPVSVIGPRAPGDPAPLPAQFPGTRALWSRGHKPSSLVSSQEATGAASFQPEPCAPQRSEGAVRTLLSPNPSTPPARPPAVLGAPAAQLPPLWSINQGSQWTHCPRGECLCPAGQEPRPLLPPQPHALPLEISGFEVSPGSRVHRHAQAAAPRPGPGQLGSCGHNGAHTCRRLPGGLAQLQAFSTTWGAQIQTPLICSLAGIGLMGN